MKKCQKCHSEIHDLEAQHIQKMVETSQVNPLFADHCEVCITQILHPDIRPLILRILRTIIMVEDL